MSTQDFQSMMKSLQQTAKLITETLVPHIQKMMEGVHKAMEPLARQIRLTLEAHELNIKTGWWYPDYIVDNLPDAKVHAALQKEAETGAFTRLVVRECRRNDQALLREMSERWRGYSFIGAKRKQILADIISAHIDKKYTLSIPVAMAQVDYFYHQLFPDGREDKLKYDTKDNVAAGQQLNFAKHFGKDDYKRVPASTFFELYPVYHYFKNVLYANQKLRSFQKVNDPEMYKLSNPNNRGSILHGTNANYSSEARSLKQILLLDKLLHVTSKLHRNRLTK